MRKNPANICQGFKNFVKYKNSLSETIYHEKS